MSKEMKIKSRTGHNITTDRPVRITTKECEFDITVCTITGGLVINKIYGTGDSDEILIQPKVSNEILIK
jgi:hypothetical protein